MWSRLRSWHQDRCRVRGQQPVNSEAWPGTIWDPVCRGQDAGGVSRELPSGAALTPPPPTSPSLPSFSLPTFSLLT